MKENFGKFENREFKRLEKARERYERRENEKDKKELKRYEKALDRGLDLRKNWL